MATKLTAFQKLDRALTGNWGVESQPHVNSYSVDKASDIIFRTTDKAEYEKTKLELQQSKFLKDQWYKSNVNLEVGAFSNLNYIQLMYRDAELMDAFPEIGAALDTFSEEASLVGPDSNIVNVYSKSERIKAILEDLFVNRLNLQIMAPMVIRAMCKYGNQFMLLNIDNKLGVKGWRQLPVFDVQRIENGIQNPYAGGGISIASNTTDTTDNDPDVSTMFIWNSQGQAQVPFRNWQIGHFRLLNNSMYLPYGVSILNSARRHFRMLSLMEDMMFIYRLDRSMERRVYKIFVGAIDDADVPAYVENIANQFKRTPIIDPMTGQVDLRKNVLPVRRDTPIPLLDGRTITIEELAKEYEEGKENFVYSVQDGTHQIVPGKVAWCGKNYTAEKLVKITLDDDSYMVMAPEHEIIMRDGSKKRADVVSVGESVMPLYRDKNPKSKKLFERYEKVYNPYSGKYEFTHRIMANHVDKIDEKYNTVHHKDFNKYNNNPTNLLWMDYHEHHKMHGDLARKNWQDPEKRKLRIQHLSESCKGRVISEDTRKKISETFKKKYASGELDFLKERVKERIIKYNSLPETIELRRKSGNKRGYIEGFKNYNNSDLHKEHDEIRRIATIKSWEGEGRTIRLEKLNISFDEQIWDSMRDVILEGKINNRQDLLDYFNKNLIDHLIEINDNRRLENNHFISRHVMEKNIKAMGFSGIWDYVLSIKKNHKISAIEYVTGDDVYCMTVVGLNGEDDRHNFALTTCKSDGSLNDSGVFVSNCVDNDIFIPVRREDAPTPIDTLSAGQNLTAMDDIKFVQNKLATALRIPKAFMNFEDAAGDGKNLALMDIRFTRIINHIQQAFLMELTKIASIHLYLLGFGDDITNFSLTMNNPSTQAEQLEIDNLQKKIGACRDAMSDPGNGIPVMSQMRALKQIMKWSEKDIKENLEEIRLERAIAAELEKTTQIIKRTNIFDTVDRIYGEPGAEYVEDPQQGQGPDQGMGGPMGGGGGGSFGGGLDDIGAPGAPTDGDINGETGSEPTADMDGGSTPNEPAQQPSGTPMESRMKRPVLTENKNGNRLDALFEAYMSKLDKGVNEKKTVEVKRTDIVDKALIINEEFTKMMDSLDEIISED